MRKLEQVLEIQESERSDDKFSRTCLFCRTHFEGRVSFAFSSTLQNGKTLGCKTSGSGLGKIVKNFFLQF
jgi:hypothetical protein